MSDRVQFCKASSLARLYSHGFAKISVNEQCVFAVSRILQQFLCFDLIIISTSPLDHFQTVFLKKSKISSATIMKE